MGKTIHLGGRGEGAFQSILRAPKWFVVALVGTHTRMHANDIAQQDVRQKSLCWFFWGGSTTQKSLLLVVVATSPVKVELHANVLRHRK